MWRRIAAAARAASPAGDAVDDRLVLGMGERQAARIEDEMAGAIEIGAGVVDDGADAW